MSTNVERLVLMIYISISKYSISQGTPSIRVQRHKDDKEPVYANEIEIKGPSKILSDFVSPVIPLFGVHVAIVTEAEVEVKR